jgi:hypothetical protein
VEGPAFTLTPRYLARPVGESDQLLSTGWAADVRLNLRAPCLRMSDSSAVRATLVLFADIYKPLEVDKLDFRFPGRRQSGSSYGHPSIRQWHE